MGLFLLKGSILCSCRISVHFALAMRWLSELMKEGSVLPTSGQEWLRFYPAGCLLRAEGGSRRQRDGTPRSRASPRPAPRAPTAPSGSRREREGEGRAGLPWPPAPGTLPAGLSQGAGMSPSALHPSGVCRKPPGAVGSVDPAPREAAWAGPSFRDGNCAETQPFLSISQRLLTALRSGHVPNAACVLLNWYFNCYFICV